MDQNNQQPGVPQPSPDVSQPELLHVGHRPNPLLLGLGGIILLGVGLIGGYMVANMAKSSETPSQTQQVSQTSPTTTQEIASPTNIPPTASVNSTTANWKTFENSEFSYSLKYPMQWVMKEQEFSDTKSIIFSVNTSELLLIHTDAPGRGCGPVDPDTIKTGVMQIGSKTIAIENFCGSNTYIINAKTTSGKVLTIDVNFIATSYEADGREVLKSLQGLTPVEN